MIDELINKFNWIAFIVCSYFVGNMVGRKLGWW